MNTINKTLSKILAMAICVGTTLSVTLSVSADESTTEATTTTTTTTTTTAAPGQPISYEKNGEGIVITAYRWKGEQAVTIPDTIEGLPVTEIGEHAFRYCYADSIVLPDTVREIGAYAFSGCRYIKAMTIPKDCRNIGDGAFEDCTALDTVTFPEVLPEIGASAFDRTAYVLKADGEFVIIGDGLLYAYHGTATTLTLPDSVKVIHGNAFSGNKSLTSVTIPESVTHIHKGAFSGCSELSSITLLGTPTLIHRDAFSETKWFFKQKGNVVVLGTVLLALRGDETAPTLPDGVTELAGGACSGNPALTTIKLPDSVTRIQQDAFRDCTSLQVVTMGDGLLEIGSHAFSGCSTLSYLRLGHSLRRIGDRAFLNCDALTELYLPDTVSEIGREAIGRSLGEHDNSLRKNDALTIFSNAEAAISYANAAGLSCAPLPDAENTKPAPVIEPPKRNLGGLSFLTDPSYRAGLIGTGLSVLLLLVAVILRRKDKKPRK